MQIDSTIFRAYDIRGIYPDQINAELAYKIGQAYAKFTAAKIVAVGRDARTSGPVLFKAIAEGLTDHGVDVVDIGVITTDMYYFAVANEGYDGGIMISASHNPAAFNGFKMVRAKAVPISGDNGIPDIQQIVLSNYKFQADKRGKTTSKDIMEDYLKKCLTFVDVSKVKPLRVVANAMFGPVLQNVQRMNLPIELIMLNEIPDGSFPKGAPDPLLEENRTETVERVIKEQADLGAAWDGDADRFFLFDETGRFIPGYYLTAFLGQYFAKTEPGAKIIHDPRLTWAVEDAVARVGGVALVNKAGHSFFKERMRQEDAVFAGEMSGHFYFRDFFYADNGLIPFLLVLKIISESGKKTSELFNQFFEQYFISGEINTKLPSLDLVGPILQKILGKYADAKVNKIDGVSVEYPVWRANIRSSNTEPLIRLNVEARDSETLKQKTEELLELIRQ